MFKFLLRTVDSLGPTVLRLFLAGVMFPHGAQKMLGWFGGQGYASTVKHFTQTMHLPMPLAVAVIVTEFVGPICLLLGFLTRIWALGMGILITTAAALVHLPNGFFMNWYGTQKGEGYEYHLLVLGISLALLILGGGKLSADGALSGKESDGAKGGGLLKK